VVHRLVLELLPDREISHDFDAEVVQILGGTDSGSEQNGRAAYGTRRQDDLPGLIGGSVDGLDAGCGPAAEQDPVSL
jgi:hypothetical protein